MINGTSPLITGEFNRDHRADQTLPNNRLKWTLWNVVALFGTPVAAAT